MNDNLIIDNGILAGKTNLTITFPGTLDFKETHLEILETWNKYNDSDVSHKNFFEQLFNILGFETTEPKPGFLLLIHPKSPSDYVSVVLLIESDTQVNNNNMIDLLFTSLSYAANYYGVRFGILAKGNLLLVCDFTDEDYQSHYLAVDLSILDQAHDICDVAFISLLFGYIYNSSSLTTKSRTLPGGKKSTSKKIPNRRKYTDNPHVTELIKLLEEKIFSLDDGIQMVEKVAYASYELNNSKICEINIQTRQLKIWVPLTIDEIIDPKIPVRDVRKIGHYGTGNTEITLKGINEIDQVFDIITQSYRNIP
ncbi:MAG: hypothetical protein ACTSYF_12880 [Promethearchaeota archaeon]